MEETNEEMPIKTDPVSSARCPACGAEIDVEGIASFTPVSCPACGAEFEVPAQFGQFRLLKMLGHGGMGGVFLGRDEMLDRQVAIKVMLKSLGDDPEFAARFQREAQAAARLNHPHIAQIYSFGTEHGQPYIAMELVSNGSLDKKMEREPGSLDPAYVMRVGQQIAEGLKIAAESGLVHGDVKPENILFDGDGNAKLVDFGLAAMQGDSSEIWGTPYYISPEKVKRQKIDFRADIYSLGGTLYHALTGHAPFEGEDATAVVKARIGGLPVKPSELRPGIPEALDKIIMRMLEEEPARRYPTYDSLLGDMNRYLSEASRTGKHPGIAKGKKLVIKGMRKTSPLASADGTDGYSVPELQPLVAEQKPGMSLGKKAAIVAGSIFGGLLLFGGLLTWILWPKDTSGEVLQKAKESIAENRKAVETSRMRVTEAVQGFTEKLEKFTKKYEETVKNVGDFNPSDRKHLVFPETKELLAARKRGGAEGAGAPAGAQQQPEAQDKKRESAAKAAAAAAKASADRNKDPAQLHDGEDPNDPDVQDRIAKARAEQEAKKEQGTGEEGEVPGAAKPEQEDAPAERPSEDVGTLRKIWDVRCKVLAAHIDLLAQEREFERLVSAFEEAASGTVSKATADKAGEIAQSVADLAQKIQEAAKDTLMGQQMTRLVQIDKKVREKLEKRERLAKHEAEEKRREAERAERNKEEERKRDERRERELAEADRIYADIEGLLANMKWDIAINQIEREKANFVSPEGLAKLDIVTKKATYMRDLHLWLVDTAKGVYFPENYPDSIAQKAKLKGQFLTGEFHVVEATRENIVIHYSGKDRRGESKKEERPGPIMWQQFCKNQKGWFNYLVLIRVEQVANEDYRGRPNEYRYQVSPKQYASYMIGAALMYQIYMPEDPRAQKKVNEFVNKAVKRHPECYDDAVQIFPDMEITKPATVE